MSDHYDIETVRNCTDIVKVVGEYIRLRRAATSGHYTGLCPFHQERTPSLNVHQARQLYKCFGCGVGGDVIKFVMEIEGFTFAQALKALAARAGISPAGRLTGADRRQYALAAAGTDALAQRLADLAHGLELVIERAVAILSPWLDVHLIDSAAALAGYHRGLYLLRKATAQDIGELWRAMHGQATALARAGQQDREQAESVTSAVVDLLALSQRRDEAI